MASHRFLAYFGRLDWIVSEFVIFSFLGLENRLIFLAIFQIIDAFFFNALRLGLLWLAPAKTRTTTVAVNSHSKRALAIDMTSRSIGWFTAICAFELHGSHFASRSRRAASRASLSGGINSSHHGSIDSNSASISSPGLVVAIALIWNATHPG